MQHGFEAGHSPQFGQVDRRQVHARDNQPAARVILPDQGLVGVSVCGYSDQGGLAAAHLKVDDAKLVLRYIDVEDQLNGAAARQLYVEILGSPTMANTSVIMFFRSRARFASQ